MSEHTPTPWTVAQIGQSGPKIYGSAPDGEAVCQLFDKNAYAFLNADANAAFIVKAVNAHETLVRALESLAVDPPATLDEPDTDCEVIAKMRTIARDALARVGIAGDTP